MASSRFAFMLRALRHRNYRLFFGGQLVSLVGTWMTTTATSWLVYRLTGSPWILGLVAFASQFPAFVMSPVAGTLIDRWDRRKVLVVTQFISMLQSFALAALTLGGGITVSWVIALLIAQSLVNAFDMPGRQAFVVELVDKSDLPNAIALNSSMFNGARLVGPSIAGGIIAAAGEGWIFLIDGFSYFGVMLALLSMRTSATGGRTRAAGGMWNQLREGWTYIAEFAPIRAIMTLLALVSLLGFPYTVLMPIFATQVLRGGPNTLGLLMGAIGCGALCGALTLAARQSVRGLGRLIPTAAATFGASLIAFSLSRHLVLSIAILVVSGFAFITQMASSNTLIQTIVDDSKRGRVMSFYVMAFLGTGPIGSLLAGWLASRIGAPYTVLTGGVCCVAVAGWFARELPKLRAVIRPIYVRMGIMPDVAVGLQAATPLMSPPKD